MTRPDFVTMILIDCTRDALWEALTSGAVQQNFHFAADRIDGHHATPGDALVIRAPDGSPMVTNELVSIDPKTRIEITFQPHWAPDLAPSRAVYLIEDQPTGMKLTVEHYDIPEDQEGIGDGWARFISGLKTWLETGRGHRFTTPARAAREMA